MLACKEFVTLRVCMCPWHINQITLNSNVAYTTQMWIEHTSQQGNIPHQPAFKVDISRYIAICWILLSWQT